MKIYCASNRESFVEKLVFMRVLGMFEAKRLFEKDTVYLITEYGGLGNVGLNKK